MKKIIIIGAGFAGLSCAQRLSRAGLGLEITLFDKKGQFNFLPLIPDCLGRAIKPEFLVNDVAGLSFNSTVGFVKEEVISVDLGSRQLQTNLATYAYDYLVIASGSEPNFFANSQAQNYGYPLNNVMDVQAITDCLKKNSFDNLIICGAGYTGVEAATNLWRYFKNQRMLKKITIVERAPAILGALPEWMKDYVSKNFKSMGIQVLTNAVIEKIQADKLWVSGGLIFERAILIWVPGVKTAEFIQKLDIPKNPQGRIVADEYLRVNPYCFCAGDTAYFPSKKSFLRMAVQFAITQGDQAARNIISSIKNIPLKKYHPLDLGYVIPMANNRSCGQVLGLNVSGRLATFLHFSMCIFRSRGWRNRGGLIYNLLQGGGKC